MTNMKYMYGRYAFDCRKDASFGAHRNNLNEDRPILSQQKCRPVTLVSGNIRHMRIFTERFPGKGASNNSGVVDNGNFQPFHSLFFLNFRYETSIITYQHAVCRRLFSDPKMHDLDIPE